MNATLPTRIILTEIGLYWLLNFPRPIIFPPVRRLPGSAGLSIGALTVPIWIINGAADFLRTIERPGSRGEMNWSMNIIDAWCVVTVRPVYARSSDRKKKIIPPPSRRPALWRTLPIQYKTGRRPIVFHCLPERTLSSGTRQQNTRVRFLEIERGLDNVDDVARDRKRARSQRPVDYPSPNRGRLREGESSKRPSSRNCSTVRYSFESRYAPLTIADLTLLFRFSSFYRSDKMYNSGRPWSVWASCVFEI